MKRRREKQPPPYLDGRLAGNSVSTRRSMRTPAGRFMQFFLCVMMLMAFSVQKASAYDDWNNKWISQWYDPINATIVLDIRVYQSWGGGDDGHCGFIGDDGYLTVTVAGYGIKINGRSGTWNTDDDLENMSRTTMVKRSIRTYPWNGSVPGLSRAMARAPIT